MAIGPIQAFVIGFPDNDLFEGRIADELARLSDIGQIRIVDAVFVVREGDDVAILSISDLDDDQRTELRAAVGRWSDSAWLVVRARLRAPKPPRPSTSMRRLWPSASARH